jgi:hypothetical protein
MQFFFIESEAIGLNNVFIKFVKPSLIPLITSVNFLLYSHISGGLEGKQDNTVAQNIQPI